MARTAATAPSGTVLWSWLAALPVVALAHNAAAAGDFEIYVSYSKGGMPVFTDAPATSDARLIFGYRENGSRSVVKTAASSTHRGSPDQTMRSSGAEGGPTVFRRRSEDSTAAVVRYWERFRAVIPLVQEAARRYDIEPALLLAVMEVESGFQPGALSPAGAIGLMQLIPDTTRRYGVTDPWDPRANIDGGSRYLRDLLARFSGDLKLALAGYNAGEAAVVSAGWRVPPIAETQSYVSAVLHRFRHWRGVLAAGGEQAPVAATQ